MAKLTFKDVIESATTSEGLKKNKDFKVVSLVALDYDFDMHTLNEFLDKDTVKQIEQSDNTSISDIVKMNNDIMEVSKTPFLPNKTYHLYKFKGEVNFENAIICGLGVVRMSNGEELIYNASEIINNEYEEINNTVTLSLYAQLSYENYDDKGLERVLNEHEELIKTMSPMGDQLFNKIREVFNSKKGGNNVIEFKRK